MRPLLLSLGLLAACGDKPCEAFVRGLCIVETDYELDYSMIELAVDADQSALEQLGYSVALVDEIEARGVSVEYVSSHVVDYRGQYDDGAITVVYGEGGPDLWRLCVDRYYVLSHELLHMVADSLYGDPDKAHSSPLFIHTFTEDSSELLAYMAVKRECIARFPIEEV